MESKKNTINIDKLKSLQIEILDAVDFFCRCHDIHYWLDSGTLIGAVRHKGYIPWDDDIDIGMLRQDYDRFVLSFNNENDRYQVCSPETDRHWGFPWGKILDTRTVLYEPDEKGLRTSVNIDLFVYDNAPDNNKQLRRMYDRRDRWMYLRDIRLYASVRQQHNPLKKLGILLANIPCRGWIERRIVRNSQRFAYCNTSRVGNFTCKVRMACSKSVFNDFTTVEFEGKQYPAPEDYDQWLRSLYGNYMQLPPEEKRVSHHQFVAWMQ